MPKINHPAKLAITIARDEDRTHYFDDREEFDDFVRGLLVGEDEGRNSPTDFKLYSKAGSEWVEQDFDPYDYFQDIDDTLYPLAHGQLLANYGQWVNHKTLWDIAQGNSKAIALIDDAFTRSRVETTFKRLSELGAWASDESDPVFTEYETEDQDFDQELDHWLTQI